MLLPLEILPPLYNLVMDFRRAHRSITLRLAHNISSGYLFHVHVSNASPQNVPLARSSTSKLASLDRVEGKIQLRDLRRGRVDGTFIDGCVNLTGFEGMCAADGCGTYDHCCIEDTGAKWDIGCSLLSSSPSRR